MKHFRFEKLEEEHPISFFFNSVMRRLQNLLTLCAPDTFDRPAADAFQDVKFCDFCRYELWMHKVVERLEEWDAKTNEYFNEFNGSWKYYAAAKRREYIREYGEDGMPPEDTRDCVYLHYSVIKDMYDDGFRDIVQDTVPSHLKGLCADLLANSEIDIITEMREFFGGNIEAYKKDEDGNMRPVSAEEHDLDMVTEKVAAEDDSKRIMAIASGVFAIKTMLQACNPFDDNKELLHMVGLCAVALLNMDFTTLDEMVKLFNKEYASS